MVGPKVVPAILDAGHGFDLFDDGTLAEAQARGYKAIVLPGVRWMPEATTRWMQDHAARGGLVLAARRCPTGMARPRARAEDGLAARLARGVTPDVTLTPPTPAIGFVHRRLADADVYFLANTGNTPAQRAGPLPRRDARMRRAWDALTRHLERLDAAAGEVALDFEPYGSRVVVFRAAASAAPSAPSRTVIATEELALRLEVSFGGAARDRSPCRTRGQTTPRDAFFSGTARYRRSVVLPPAFRAAGTRVFLDFGDAQADRARAASRRHAARQLLRRPASRRRCARRRPSSSTAAARGSVWAPPYRLDVTVAAAGRRQRDPHRRLQHRDQPASPKAAACRT